jgi:hypothetical protein
LATINFPEFKESKQEYTPELAKLQAHFVRLWCFGDAFLMPKLQNEAMKALLSCLNHSRVSVEALRLTFANTAADSTLRKAINDEFLYDYVASVEGSGCRGMYTEDMISEMASIPGLMSNLTKKLIQYGGAGGVRATEQDVSIFMVT